MAELKTFNTRCVFCKQVHVFTVEKAKFDRWKGGEYIQSVWPESSPDDRERMISGTCPECWEKHIGG